jgi:hypothetical protein
MAKKQEIYYPIKVGKKLYMYTGKKRIGEITQKWVRLHHRFSAKEIRVEGRCEGFRAGWHELSLDNEFTIDKDWRAFRVKIKCPTCGKITH